MPRLPESFAVTSSLWDADTPAWRHAHEAMHGEFQITLLACDAAVAHDAADEAFEEIDAIERMLSRFEPGSDVDLIGRLAPDTPLKVGPHTMDCLLLAREFAQRTRGVFDVTAGSVRQCWLDDDGQPLQPDAGELQAALARTGMDLLVIDPDEMTVAVRAEGVKLDLGGIGKGYAVDRAVEILREWDIETALINAAGSTFYALGCPPGREGWRLSVGEIEGFEAFLPACHVHVRDRSVSGSGVLSTHEHIYDLASGQPVRGRHGAWAAAPTAAESDALSTAFLLMPPADVQAYCAAHPGTAALLALVDTTPPKPVWIGPWGQTRRQ